MIEKTDYEVDSEELKKYFPLERVVDGMLDIYQRLLGLQFTEIGSSAQCLHNNSTSNS